MDSLPLHELLDACRPGSDDLAQPEMAAVRAELETNATARRHAARVEQFDRNVAAALHDVPLPAGLRERLLAKLAENATPAEIAAADAAAISVAHEEIPSAHAAGGRRRRFVLATMGALAALAACALVAVSMYTGEENWGPAVIAEAAAPTLEYYTLRIKAPNAGELPAYPLSQFVLAGRQPPRFKVGNIAGCSGVAYRLQSRQGVPGVLFVLKPWASVEGFPLRPATPQVDTAGRIAVSWAEQGRLYVLVFNGTTKDYPGFLRQSGPIAMADAPRLL